VENLTIKILNHLGSEQVPFIFIIDFDKKMPWICPLSEVDSTEVLYDINGRTNEWKKPQEQEKKEIKFDVNPVPKNKYKQAFDLVQEHISHGDTFLLNLTMPSRVETNLKLEEIFHYSKARYKLWYKGHFVVFSPECFIKTHGRKIRAFPMKGTIDATIPDAKNKLLKNEKELAEHYTIVDLIRNDLSMVAKNVKVEKFQIIDHIKTNRNELLQMSTEISGELPEDYHSRVGDILFSMLPAGSISGAPKTKTLEIIKVAEQYDRGYYTGVFGIFDGENIDSGVMIRFLEKSSRGLLYKSGGGITTNSNCEEEYQELINKIYLPV
jgi:para-aminobenzoate synthetase component I